VRYAVIGGFSMGAMGIMRSTMDLDFLVDTRDLLKVNAIMKKYDYKCVNHTENVSQYVGPAKVFGEIDLIYAFREASLSMLKRAKMTTVLNGKVKIKVLSPEDIIGLKVQALANNPERENREFADIEDIMRYFGAKLNWNFIKEYFGLFGKEIEFKELKSKYGNAK
jgi:hypothetical protein